MYLPNRFKSNPFDKHIFKIGNIVNLLSEKKTVGGLDLDISLNLEDEGYLHTAIHYLNNAIIELKKIDKQKGLLR